MKTVLYTAIIILLMISSFSCNDNKIKDDTKKYYANGMLEKMTVYNKGTSQSKTVYWFYETGEIKAIQRYDKNGNYIGEQLSFYSSGILEAKMRFINRKANGNAYRFYDTSGALKHFRYYRNDKEVLYGGDYWGDSIDIMKASLHFNDSGQIFYKKNFDENGKFISEEGKRR